MFWGGKYLCFIFLSFPTAAAHQREGSENSSAPAGRDILGEVDQTSAAAELQIHLCSLAASQSQSAATSLVISGNRVVFLHERGFALPRGASGEIQVQVFIQN